jgi:hypothetical protein
MPKPDARTLLFERIRTRPAKFVHVRGVPYTVTHEVAENPEDADHIHLTLEVPPFGRLRAAVNTFSRLNRDAGFDPRVRMAIIAAPYEKKPDPGLEELPGQDYAQLEAILPITYEFYDREALATLLMEKMKRAIRAEIWGELYARDHLGIHQIHSRRASCAVAIDLKNRDGALKLYYPTDNLSELLLFKFCGQP